MQFQYGSVFILQHVQHVTQLKQSLISTGKLDDDGFPTTFVDGKWKIFNGSRVIARGCRSDTLYSVHVTSVSDHVVAVIEQPSVSLWHGLLTHMNQTGMKVVSRLGYCLVFVC